MAKDIRARNLRSRRNKKKTKFDRWENPFNQFGTDRDVLNRTQFQPNAFSIDRSTAENMFRFDWTSRRVAEIIPEDATREWIDIIQEDPELVTAVNTKMDELELQAKFEEGMTLARIHGGAIGILGVDDGQDPEMPLNLDSIKSFDFLHIVDRWQVTILRNFSDPLEPNFDTPEFLMVNPQVAVGAAITPTSNKIHSSRVIFFHGNYVTRLQRSSNAGWHDSIYVALEDALKNFGVSFRSLAILMQDFITKVLKIPNLAELLSTEEGRQNLEYRLQVTMAKMSSLGISVIGDEEEYAKIQTPIAGLPKAIELMMEVLAGASGIPRARFFGQQLGKLAGATETTRAYYDMIGAVQEKKIRPPLDYVLSIILNTKDFFTKGNEPETWGFEFVPLWSDPQETVISTRKDQAEIDKIYFEIGALSEDEIAENRFPQEGYSFETQIDLEEREKINKEEEEDEEEEVRQTLLEAERLAKENEEAEKLANKNKGLEE
jgi:phage-related protein (TIGR01555 family)